MTDQEQNTPDAGREICRIQFANLKENTPEEKEVFRSMYFQFASHTIDKTFDAEKKMKDDLSDVPFA